MSKYKSRFQDSWLVHESYRSWIEKDNGDVFSAKCKWCLKSFRVGGLGESALKSHATSTKHQKAAAARSGSSKLTTLFRSQGQPAQPKPSSVLSEDCSSQPDVCPSSQNSSVTNFIAREDTLSAEVIWTLHTIKNHQSFNSNTGVGKTFQRMFPDSTIAKSFGLSERKTAYLATFGLAPYIHSLLEKSLTQAPFVILFDESMNKEFQNKQMDFYVRMWDGDIVRTRYFTSKFMGHATAEDMKACFMSVTDQLNLQNVIQLSMDGPNVNWSFHGKINSYLKSEYSIELLNTGSCGIHKVHGACKAAMDACDWHLDTIMKACHKLFSDTPARREDFTKVTGSHLFPLQFCKHRWLENVRVAQRLLDLLPCLKSYVNSVKQGENPAPMSLSYATVKDSVCDLFLPAKLGFFISFSKQVEPFLTYYQADKPLLPFMLADIHSLAFKILDRFMKDEALARIKSTSDFCTFDVKEPSGHVHINKIKIGIVAESLLKELKFQKKVSDLQIRGFREACKKTLISFMSKFLDKSPLKYKFVTYLSCLDPEVIMANKAEATIKMRRILLEMVEKRAFPLSECDEILEEFSMLIDSTLTSGSLAQFSKDNDRLDTFYHDQLAHRRFSKVGPVIKQLLLLSHGQATVERGFSVNKELEDSNLNEHTLIARRLIVDFINSVGGIDNVEITPKLLVNAGSAYSRYKMYLDAEKEKKEKAQRGLKRKHLDTEIEELSKKKKALMSDTAALNASADDYALRAENERKISHIIHSNSLKKRAKEKEDEIKEVERLLDNKLLELKSSL